jgi:hypothetical protein
VLPPPPSTHTLDAPSAKSCGSGRERLGLNDAGYQVYQSNYNIFLEQFNPDSTSYGAWRAGPEDEIFGRYGRSVPVPTAEERTKDVAATGMAFKVLGGVFDAHTSDVFGRVVFLRTKTTAASTSADFVVSYSTTAASVSGSTTAAAKCTSKDITSAKDDGEHWIEVQFPISVSGGGQFGGGGCSGADVVISQPGSEKERIVFNLIEISKEDFAFRLSQWMERQ